MLLDDCYRLLDLDPRASDEEVKRAHRDLMKVWHPDRFGHDPSLRRKAEEKLKAINDAHDTIRAARGDGWRGSDAVRDERPAGALHPRDRIRRYRTWATTCALLAIFFLFRRPTPAGLVIALILLGVAVALILRMRALPRE